MNQKCVHHCKSEAHFITKHMYFKLISVVMVTVGGPTALPIKSGGLSTRDIIIIVGCICGLVLLAISIAVVMRKFIQPKVSKEIITPPLTCKRPWLISVVLTPSLVALLAVFVYYNPKLRCIVSILSGFSTHCLPWRTTFRARARDNTIQTSQWMSRLSAWPTTPSGSSLGTSSNLVGVAKVGVVSVDTRQCADRAWPKTSPQCIRTCVNLSKADWAKMWTTVQLIEHLRHVYQHNPHYSFAMP